MRGKRKKKFGERGLNVVFLNTISNSFWIDWIARLFYWKRRKTALKPIGKIA
jgi:hypothetical protein